MTDTSLRIRAFLDRRFELVAALFILLVLVGGWATYTTHIAPGTTTEERIRSSWESTGTFAHNATVVRDTQVYSKGTVLENRQTYFTAISPVLRGAHRFSYGASEDGSLNVAANATLVIRSVSEQDDGNVTHWRSSRPLASENTTDVGPDETVEVPFTIDVPQVGNRSAEIQNDLGGSAGQIEQFVSVTVHVQGRVNGQRVEQTERYQLPLKLASGVYQIPWDSPVTNERRNVEAVSVPREYGPVREGGGPLALILGTGYLVILVFSHRRNYFSLSDAEREWLAYDDDRTDFDEWITSISIPDEALNNPRAEATSLQDLVDYAIDTDNAVIEDADRKAYFVFHDGIQYVYERPEPVTDSDNVDTELDTWPLIDKAKEHVPTGDVASEDSTEK
ncbi:DUF5305 domain-containing protein [Halorussus salinus]|uniref:DUF5305 domain-containing protein n=1 Tax=Halorussus salinus TaxID=1364935 RepID=UPI0010931C46|nr:DUF5305 domain-containing protein [Halorussus salinus]